jgi:periplasmic protein TonB
MNPAYPVVISTLTACLLLAAGCATTSSDPLPAASRSTAPIAAAPIAADPNVRAFDISLLDQPPVARFQTPPQYPFELRRQKVTGEAVVDFIVDTEGNVRNAYAIRSTHPEFGDAAVQAVVKWKFKPGRKGGRDVNTHMQVPLVFTLNAK